MGGFFGGTTAAGGAVTYAESNPAMITDADGNHLILHAFGAGALVDLACFGTCYGFATANAGGASTEIHLLISDGVNTVNTLLSSSFTTAAGAGNQLGVGFFLSNSAGGLGTSQLNAFGYTDVGGAQFEMIASNIDCSVLDYTLPITFDLRIQAFGGGGPVGDITAWSPSSVFLLSAL